jgi:hypothetical protein
MQELDGEKTKFYGRLGCSLIDFLLVSSAFASFPESEAGQALDDLLKDIFACIQEVGTILILCLKKLFVVTRFLR